MPVLPAWGLVWWYHASNYNNIRQITQDKRDDWSHRGVVLVAGETSHTYATGQARHVRKPW